MNNNNTAATAAATTSSATAYARSVMAWYSPSLKAALKAACEEIEREEAEKAQFARTLAEASGR